MKQPELSVGRVPLRATCRSRKTTMSMSSEEPKLFWEWHSVDLGFQRWGGCHYPAVCYTTLSPEITSCGSVSSRFSVSDNNVDQNSQNQQRWGGWSWDSTAERNSPFPASVIINLLPCPTLIKLFVRSDQSGMPAGYVSASTPTLLPPQVASHTPLSASYPPNQVPAASRYVSNSAEASGLNIIFSNQ